MKVKTLEGRAMKIGSKVRVLYTDGAGRFKEGDVGTLIENNFDKYDYFVEFEPVQGPDGPYRSLIYFYADELEPA